MASPKKGKSRAEAQFQSEYVERTREDTLPEAIKGTVVWVDEGENEGYCVYDRTSGYTPVEYLQDLRKWAIVVKSKTSG